MIQIKWWSRSNDDDPVLMIQIEWWWSSTNDPDRMMIHIKWWWSSSDDPDIVMMIQIKWSSRSSDDDLDQDKDELNMKKNWIWQGLDDYPNDIEKKTCADKLCRENTFLVKRECWCNCCFRMYSLVYLMYFTLMFIPKIICNVIESCHALMFRSGDSIM